MFGVFSGMAVFVFYDTFKSHNYDPNVVGATTNTTCFGSNRNRDS